MFRWRSNACANLFTCRRAEMHNRKLRRRRYITTPPDTNSSDGQYARIGISRGIGNRAIVVADRMGATAFVELNADDTPIGLLTLQKDLRVIKSRQSIDTNGMVFAPHQSPGVCTRLR